MSVIEDGREPDPADRESSGVNFSKMGRSDGHSSVTISLFVSGVNIDLLQTHDRCMFDVSVASFHFQSSAHCWTLPGLDGLDNSFSPRLPAVLQRTNHHHQSLHPPNRRSTQIQAMEFRRPSNPVLIDCEDLHEVKLVDTLEQRADLQESSLGARPASFDSTVREILFVLFCAFVGASFWTLQRTTTSMTHAIELDLDLTMAEVIWTTASSGLTAAVFILPWACISKNLTFFARKCVLLGSIALFSLVVGLAGLARSGVVLDVLIGFSGIACSIHLFMLTEVIGSIYTNQPQRKALVIATTIATGNALAVVLGNVCSGAVSVHLGWRAAYVWVSLLYVFFLALGGYAIPNTPREITTSLCDDQQGPGMPDTNARLPWKTLCSKLDWPGTLLIFTGLASITIVLSVAPQTPQAWTNPYCLVLVFGGIISLLAYGLLRLFTVYRQSKSALSTPSHGVRHYIKVLLVSEPRCDGDPESNHRPMTSAHRLAVRCLYSRCQHLLARPQRFSGSRCTCRTSRTSLHSKWGFECCPRLSSVSLLLLCVAECCNVFTGGSPMS